MAETWRKRLKEINQKIRTIEDLHDRGIMVDEEYEEETERLEYQAKEITMDLEYLVCRL